MAGMPPQKPEHCKAVGHAGDFFDIAACIGLVVTRKRVGLQIAFASPKRTSDDSLLHAFH